MSKHTKGPWATDLPEHDAPYQNIKIKAGHQTVCTVWIDDAPCHDFNSEQIANARLIAAAPELLEALASIAWIAVGEGDVCKIIAKRARAAIAKATKE